MRGSAWAEDWLWGRLVEEGVSGTAVGYRLSAISYQLETTEMEDVSGTAVSCELKDNDGDSDSLSQNDERRRWGCLVEEVFAGVGGA
jgi:hypothetical protein